jgi:hypothetical protein
MNTANHQSNQQIKTSALCGTGEAHQPDVKVPATKMQAATAINQMRGFIGSAQLQMIGHLCQGEERQFFYDKMVELANIIGSMPVTYQTDGEGDQAVVQLHYFTQGCDWYITERDMENEQLQAFGMADLGYGGELGYVSIVELLECGAELNLHWKPKTLAQVNAERQMQDVNYTGHPMHY